MFDVPHRLLIDTRQFHPCMRWFMVSILLLTAGCLERAAPAAMDGVSEASDENPQPPGAPDHRPAQEATPEASASDSNASAPSPPPPMHWEAGFTVGADLGTLNDTPCGALSSCDHRSFTLAGTFDLEATLSWGLATNDFDLYLFQDGIEISRDGIDEPGDYPTASQVLVHESLAPGSYELWVVGSLMVKDSYALDAVFATP